MKKVPKDVVTTVVRWYEHIRTAKLKMVDYPNDKKLKQTIADTLDRLTQFIGEEIGLPTPRLRFDEYQKTQDITRFRAALRMVRKR